MKNRTILARRFGPFHPDQIFHELVPEDIYAYHRWVVGSRRRENPKPCGLYDRLSVEWLRGFFFRERGEVHVGYYRYITLPRMAWDEKTMNSLDFPHRMESYFQSWYWSKYLAAAGYLTIEPKGIWAFAIETTPKVVVLRNIVTCGRGGGYQEPPFLPR